MAERLTDHTDKLAALYRLSELTPAERGSRDYHIECITSLKRWLAEGWTEAMLK